MEQPLSLQRSEAASINVGGDAGARLPCALALQARDWGDCQDPGFVAAWEWLTAAAAEPNPFYEPWYLGPSLSALDPQRRVKLLLLHADGVLAGLLPVRFDHSYYGYPLPHWRNWVHANCFLGQPLVAAGFERSFWREVLAWCDRQSGPHLFLHLAHCPPTGPLHDALCEELAAQQRPAATVLCEERAMLASDLAPQDYLAASLSAKKRKELRRQHRRLAELGELQVERLHGEDGVADWADEFLALERRGWKGEAGSALACDAATSRLFVEALSGAAGRGKLERLALRLGGAPIAMLASFLTPPGAYSYKTTFDEQFARFSPGVLLQCENLGMLSRSDIRWVDSCASQEHPMIDHFWRERRAIARHSIAVGGTLRRFAFTRLSRRETGHRPGGLA